MDIHFKSISNIIVITVFLWQASAFQGRAQVRNVAITIHLRGVYESKISLLSLSGNKIFKSSAEVQGIKNGETTRFSVSKENLPGEFVLRFDYKEKESSTPYPSEKYLFINDQDMELWISPIYCNNVDSTWFQKGERENATFVQFSKENGRQKDKLGLLQNFLMNYDDTEIKQELIGALMYISNPKSIETIKHIIETSNNDEVQAKAIFVYAEFAGYDGITYLKSIKAVGEKSKEEQNSGIDWLTKGTSLKNKYGIEVTNNYGFIEDYRNIKSPAIIWLNKEGLLDDKEAQMPTPLSKEKKEILLDLLIKSRGFGLEAAKAQLFLSIEYSDIDKLLMLRQVICYSPNDFAESRLNTIGIFIRYLRKTKK